MLNTCWVLFLFMVLSLQNRAAYADMYQYEGADGTMIFTDDSSKIPRKPGKMKTIPDGTVGKQTQKKVPWLRETLQGSPASERLLKRDL